MRKILIAVASIAVASAALAPAAAADSIQVQSYQRSSQTQACASQPGETPWQASWGPDASWHPSWEQWANGGSGGWTCTRSMTWALSAPDPAPELPAAGCVNYSDGFPFPLYVDFHGGWYISSEVPFADPSCRFPTLGVVRDLVFSLVGSDAARLCLQAFGASYTYSSGPDGSGQDIYFCNTYPIP